MDNREIYDYVLHNVINDNERIPDYESNPGSYLSE